MSTTLHTPSADIAARVADAIVREAIDSDSEQIIDLINGVYAEYQGCVLLVDEEEPELTDKLTILMERVQDELEDNGPFARRDFEMGELAFARMAVISQA